jgi:hypothetical protein
MHFVKPLGLRVLLRLATKKFILEINGGVTMVTGLTSAQLFNIFINAFFTRQNQSNTEIMTTEIGLNPAREKLISELKTAYPKIDLDQLQIAVNFISAFLDCIIANNEALLKSVPHVDS